MILRMQPFAAPHALQSEQLLAHFYSYILIISRGLPAKRRGRALGFLPHKQEARVNVFWKQLITVLTNNGNPSNFPNLVPLLNCPIILPSSSIHPEFQTEHFHVRSDDTRHHQVSCCYSSKYYLDNQPHFSEAYWSVSLHFLRKKMKMSEKDGKGGREIYWGTRAGCTVDVE